ncbi:MAG: response regulator [Devosia sp.]|nr:response regulator [Devosia sp.]
MTGSKILIVEDEADHGVELKRILERNGHTVLGPAPDCSSALEILWRERPDFAFVDTHLGSETCEAVLEECDNQDVPVIITTSEITGTPAFIGTRANLGKPLMEDVVNTAVLRLSA